MTNDGSTTELKLMSPDELVACGWRVPSFKQLTDNMNNRLKKLHGEDVNSETFLLRHNYKSNSNSNNV